MISAPQRQPREARLPLRRIALIRHCLFTAALVAAVLPLSCKKGGGKDGNSLSGNEVVLRVGERTITLREFFEDYDRAKLERGITGDPQAAEALKSALVSETIKRELILRRAREKGITVQAEEVAAEIGRIRVHYPGDSFREMLAEQYVAYDEWIERQKVRLLVEKTVDEELVNKMVVSEEDARAWFAAHPELAQEPAAVRVLQILVPTEEEAKLIRSRIAKGEDFASLARERSVSPEGLTGGELGVFSMGEVPEMMNVVFTLPVNTLSDVVQSEYGFHLFKVLESTPGRTLDFDSMRPKVADAVRAAKVDAAFPSWLQSLADGVKVERNDVILAAIE